MNRAKIEKLKKNIKHYAPEIIVGTSVIAGVAALIYTLKQPEGEKLLTLSPDEWTKIASGDAVKIVTDAGTIFLTKEIHKS